MAMQEVVCADCGAINQAVADACWRCLELLPVGPEGPAEVAEPQPEPHIATA